MNYKKIFYLILFFILLSCKKNENQEVSSWIKISENIQYQEQKNEFLLKSKKIEYHFEKKQLPLSKVVLLNNSLLGYFIELNQESKIVGVSGHQYIYSQKVIDLIQAGKIQNIGTDQKYDVEKILALKPEVIFTNYISSFENTYNILQKNGIRIIFLDDYLEQNPLEKTAYLKIFGKLLGVEKEANQKYLEIEKRYQYLSKKVDGIGQKPKVLVNEMYGNHWYMAGGKTFVARYLVDAKADYILKENNEEKSIPMSFEEVFAKSQNIDFWVNVSNYRDKKELLAMNPLYQKLSVFQKGKIFAINKRQKGQANDYFESGIVRSDLVLQDYIKIFHPEILPKDTLIYMKQLK